MKNLSYLLALVVVILVVYSYDVRMQQNELELEINNLYTNDLAGATEKLNDLQEAVSLSLVFTEEQEVRKQLQRVTMLSNDLRQSISALPLDEQTTTDWLSYLQSLNREAENQVYTNNWYENGAKYEKSLQMLSEEWTIASSNYFANGGNQKVWKDETLRQTAFQQVGTQLQTSNKEDFPITASESDYRKKQSLQHLTGKQWTKQQVTKKFQQLFPALKDAVMSITVNEDDAPYPFYHIQFAWGAQVGYTDFTQIGGHLLSFIIERPNGIGMIAHEQARAAADSFLQDLNIDDVKFIEARENHEAWHFVFSRVKDGVIIYPDTLQVKIAKDNGDVLGLNLMEYVKKEKVALKKIPKINPASFFTEKVYVEEERIVINENDYFELVTCYEWIVRTDGEFPHTYKVIVDSESKRVLEVDTLN